MSKVTPNVQQKDTFSDLACQHLDRTDSHVVNFNMLESDLS